MIPGVEGCFRLMKQYQMLENIKAHSIVVAKVAHLIARSLLNKGVALSLDKVTAGALLHDIGKTASLKMGGDHAAMGREICLENELEDIADIVGEHVILKNADLNGRYSEKEIVYYADKRVNHDRIVNLGDRLIYILERYGGNEKNLKERIKKNFEFCKAVERKLFRDLDFGPEALAGLAEKEILE